MVWGTAKKEHFQVSTLAMEEGEHPMPEPVSYLERMRGKRPPGATPENHGKPTVEEMEPDARAFADLESRIKEAAEPPGPPTLKERFEDMARLAEILARYDNDAAAALVDAVWEQRAQANGDADEMRTVSRARLLDNALASIDKKLDKLDEIKTIIGANVEYGGPDATKPAGSS